MILLFFFFFFIFIFFVFFFSGFLEIRFFWHQLLFIKSSLGPLFLFALKKIIFFFFKFVLFFCVVVLLLRCCCVVVALLLRCCCVLCVVLLCVVVVVVFVSALYVCISTSHAHATESKAFYYTLHAKPGDVGQCNPKKTYPTPTLSSKEDPSPL